MNNSAIGHQDMSVTDQFEPYIERSPNADAQAETLAADIAGKLTEAIQHRGRARIAFSGGSTPSLMMAQLARQDVDWSRVDITLVDERCVESDHARSNAGLLNKTLIRSLVPQPVFFPLYVPGETDAARAARFEHFAPPFDVLHLGMGDDAHTASFFPDASNIAEMLDLEASRNFMETESASSGERRVTWSLAALSRSRYVVLQIIGERKWNVLEIVLGALGRGEVTAETVARLPILAALACTQLADPDGVPGRLYVAAR